VNSLASGFIDGLAREGRVILGGDLAFTLSLRKQTPTSAHFSTPGPRLARREHARDGAAQTGARHWSK